MTLPVEWTLDARQDFARIDEFYADKSPEFAERVGDVAIETGRVLEQHPLAGEGIDFGEARKFKVGRTPFILIYRVLPDRVQILRVWHVREDWKPRPL